jgi:UDP:flavonoid glycosyltransferase YjiC (YdhE family)
MNSVTEATHLGIPMICIPLFSDQIRNAKMVENRGVAYILEKDNITADSFAEALQAVVYGNR